MLFGSEGKWKNVISKTAKNSVNTLYFLVIILLTYVAEELFRKSFFRCPCTQYTMYSMAMLICPSLFLCGLGLITSSGFWRTMQALNRMRNPGSRCNHCMKSLSSVFKPLLPVTAFLVIALLQGDYYICGRTGPSGCQSDGVNSNHEQITNESRLRMHMQSQILAFGVLLGAVVFSFGIVCIKRCFFNKNKFPDVNDLVDMEKEFLYEAFGEKLQTLVKDEVTKKVDDAFQTSSGEDMKQLLYRAKEKLFDVDRDKGSNLQLIGSRLSQVQLVEDHEEAHLDIADPRPV